MPPSVDKLMALDFGPTLISRPPLFPSNGGCAMTNDDDTTDESYGYASLYSSDIATGT